MTLKINFNKIEDKFIWFVTTFMFVSFYVFVTYTWGRYVLAGAAVIVFGLGVVLKKQFTYKFRINYFHIFQLLFAVYCLFTCVWTIDGSLSLSKTLTMFQILIFFTMLMSYFVKLDSIEPLFDVIMWSGYIVSIYTFVYYGGITTILDMLNTSIRLSNDFANSNSIGMLCAIACIIQFYKILYHKKYYSAIFMVPTMLILAVCQSRKSIIALVLGIIAIIVLKNSTKKNWIVSLFKIIISLAIFFVLLKALLSMDIFAGLNKRFDQLIITLLSPEEIDANTSAATRFSYIEIGLNYFYNRPLLGYGFGASGPILLRETTHNTYFHNNYIELLVCGGLVGFVLFYANYAYLLFNLIKMRKYAPKQTDICIIILVIMLIMEFGCVTYYNKNQYFYFMICYINLEILKRERNRLSSNVNEDCSQTL